MADQGDDPGNGPSDLYGLRYVDPRLSMDSADSSTQTLLSLMRARQAAKEREPYEALTRLLTTWMAPAAAAHRAITSSNMPRAINYHNRLEQKQGNERVNAWTKPFLSPILAMTAPSMARALRREDPYPASAFPMGRMIDKSETATYVLQPHIADTAHILNHLNSRASLAPKYKTLYSAAGGNLDGIDDDARERLKRAMSGGAQ